MDIKKIFLFLIIGIFMISLVNAFEFDNVKDYNSETKEVIVKNAFGLGDEVAKIKLNSELNVIIPRGYQKVAEFDLEYYKDSNGGLDLIEFYNIKNSMEKFERSFDYKIKEIEDVVVNDYEKVCKDVLYEDKTIVKKCSQKIIGNHIEKKVVWNDFDKKTLLKSKVVTIGIFTDVQKGDKVEWIPTFYGVEIDEWAEWTESLNVDLTAYYKLDETSGEVIDSVGSYNAENNGATTNIAGKINTAYDFEKDDAGDYIDFGNLDIDTLDFSVCMWMNLETSASTTQVPFEYSAVGLSKGYKEFVLSSGNIVFKAGNNVGPPSHAYGGTGAWIFVCGIRDNSNSKSLLYFNGNSVANGSIGTDTYDIYDNLTIGGKYGASYWYDGKFDEIGFWNRTLSASEITDLYNGGSGISYTANRDPVITLNSPDADFQSNVQIISFNCTASDDVNLINVSLYIDGVINETNSSGLNNTDYVWTKTLSVGEHNWTCEGTDNESETTTATYRDLNITLNSPTITLNSPIDYYNTTSPDLTFNCSVYDDFGIDNVSLLINGIVNETNTSGINNTDYIFTKIMDDGDYNWTCRAIDNDSLSTTQGVRHFNINTTPFIEFVSPTYANATNLTVTTIPAYVNLTETYFENLTIYLYNSGGLNQSVTFTNATRNYNFTSCLCDDYYLNATTCTTTGQCNSTETREYIIDRTNPILSTANNLTDLATYTLPINNIWNYTVNDLHTDKCYYNTSENSTYSLETCNASITTSWTTEGNKLIQFCSNDTFGNEACNTTNISIYHINYTQDSTPDFIAEGMDVTFNLTVNLTNIPTTTASLVFNGTSYEVTGTASTNGYYFETDVNIPNDLGNTTGVSISWHWNYTIVGVITDEITATETIDVYELAIDDCSSYGDMILNFSLKNEETATIVNGSLGANVEIDLKLTSKDNSSVYLEYHNTWVNDSNPQICIPASVLNNSQYWMDFTVGFDSTDCVWEFFYMDDGTLNSTKVYETFNGQTEVNIDLMDLLTADSTSFLFNYFDEDGLAVDGSIVHVMRKYIGDGTFEEIERAKADQNGDTTVHLVEEDVIYYFIITNNGVLLYTSSTYTALCQATPCTIQIEASGESAEFVTDWDLVDGGSYIITSSASTRIVNLTYENDISTTYNLTVYKYNSDGTYSQLNSSTNIGTTGSISIHVPQSAGNVSFFATVHQDDNYINSEWIDFEGKAQDRFGITLALFLSALIILSLGLMAVSEGAGTLFFVILGVAISGFLGLMTTALSTGISMVVYLILAGGILLWKLTGGRK